MGEEARSVFIFRVGDRRFGLDVEATDAVVAMAELTPFGEGPRPVCGLLDVGGDVLPVYSIRRRFGMPEREFAPEDFLVLAWARRRRVAMAVEEVFDVETVEGNWTGAEEIGVSGEPVAGVLRTEEGLIVIQDLDTFLSAEEEKQLEEALRKRQEA